MPLPVGVRALALEELFALDHQTQCFYKKGERQSVRLNATYELSQVINSEKAYPSYFDDCFEE